VGASWGNLAMGSNGRAIAPAKTMTKEQTVAKTGLLMKVLEILIEKILIYKKTLKLVAEIK